MVVEPLIGIAVGVPYLVGQPRFRRAVSDTRQVTRSEGDAHGAAHRCTSPCRDLQIFCMPRCAGGRLGDMALIKILLAIFLPPVAAFLQVGVGLHFWVNILLTLLGGIPGMVHALWLVVKDKRS